MTDIQLSNSAGVIWNYFLIKEIYPTKNPYHWLKPWGHVRIELVVEVIKGDHNSITPLLSHLGEANDKWDPSSHSRDLVNGAFFVWRKLYSNYPLLEIRKLSWISQSGKKLNWHSVTKIARGTDCRKSSKFSRVQILIICLWRVGGKHSFVLVQLLESNNKHVYRGDHHRWV